MSFEDPLLSVSLSCPLVPIPNAPWFCCEILALCKSLTYLLTLIQIQRIWLAGMATWQKRPSLQLCTINETSSKLVHMLGLSLVGPFFRSHSSFDQNLLKNTFCPPVAFPTAHGAKLIRLCFNCKCYFSDLTHIWSFNSKSEMFCVDCRGEDSFLETGRREGQNPLHWQRGKHDSICLCLYIKSHES